MHGPTYMANPLACAVASASIEVLLESEWQARIQQIERKLGELLSPGEALSQVAEVRCLGAVGVIEMKSPVDMTSIVPQFVDAGIWVRPFGKLVYLMPPYVISDTELEQLCGTLVEVLGNQAD